MFPAASAALSDFLPASLAPRKLFRTRKQFPISWKRDAVSRGVIQRGAFLVNLIDNIVTYVSNQNISREERSGDAGMLMDGTEQ